MVVIILATISAMSLFAINQAFDRRFKSQADNLLVWLNQLSDQAALEAVPYGVMGNPAGEERVVGSLHVIAYFRQYWFPVTYPESFTMEKGARIEWVSPGSTSFEDAEEYTDNEDALVPVIAFMPDGYLEPRAELILSFDSNPITFKYSWNDETAAMVVERITQ